MQLGSIACDPAKEVEGVWFHYGGGLWLRCARLWNPKHEERYASLLAQAQETHGSPLPKEAGDEAQARAFAETILLDWACADGELTDDLRPVPGSDAPVPVASLPAKVTDRRTVHVDARGHDPFDVEEEQRGDRWYRIGEDPDERIPILRCTPALSYRLLRSPMYADLRRVAEAVAVQGSRFRLAALKEQAGN